MVNLTMSHSLSSSANNRKKFSDEDSATTTTPTVFQSNLACVLNDPKKTRSEISTFFTKTWGNSFIDRSPDSLRRLGDYNLNDFETYFLSLRKSEKYGRPHLGHQLTNDLPKINPIINIPDFFLSSQFTLSDSSTFNLVFPGIIPSNRSLSPTNSEQTKCRTTSTSSDKSDRRQSTSSTNNKSTSNGLNNLNSSSPSPSHSINCSTRILQDKYSHYLDEVELLITRALSTKSHCFHDAVRSHDEIQLFLNKTRNAIESLRLELSNYDSQSLLKLLRLGRLIRQRQNQREILKRLESLSIVKQTHFQVENFLKTSDYLSALDLIDVTKDILSTQLNHLFSSRFYYSQLNELYSFIINLMRQEFGQTLSNQLLTQQDSILTNDYLEDDKLGTILIGLIRVKDEKYLDEIRSKFEQFLFDIIERTISSYSKDKTNNDQSSFNDESSQNCRYTYPSSINNHSNLFPLWIRLINELLKNSEEGLHRLRNVSQLIIDGFPKEEEEEINVPTISSLLHQIYDKLEDRLISVFVEECSHYQVNFERLSLDEYAQIIKLISNLIFNLNQFDEKYSSIPFKTFLQGQTRKFLTSFHDERKQRLANTLDNEQWRQVPIPRSIQNSIDELFNCSSSTNLNGSESLIIVNEQFILSNSALHLFMLVLDYRSCSQLLTISSINDVEHRLIELLNLFNSKTCQLVLGAGAVKLGKIRTISAKILAITCRCLQFIKITLPKIKLHFDQLRNSSESSTTIISSNSSIKQFEQLTKLYSEHIDEIHGKLISIIETTFDDTLSSYEVRAPMPSDCFRTLVTRHITAFYNAVARIVSPNDLVLLFTRLNSIFKQLLSRRLRQLKIANDGGPQHGLLTSDLLYYIKQVQNFPGLEMLELHVDEIWTTN